MELFLPMFTLGLVTSLHCVSMCGPMVASYAVKDSTEGSVYDRVKPNLAYQAAKILSYMIVGLLLGAIGGALNLDAVRPYVMVGAGVFMIVLGLGMTGYAPWAAKLTPRPPRFLVRALASTRKKAADRASHGESSLATPVTFGLLTGLMPCAPLMAAQLNAAAAGSALAGATAMLAFGLGTAPLMLGFGTASTLIPSNIKRRAMALLAIVVIGFGLVYLNRGAMLLGSPVNFESAKQVVLGGPAVETDGTFTVAADGVVEIPLVIENTQFVPATLSLPADEPVRLIVDRREANACSDQLAIPQLNLLADLAPNSVTVVDVPAAPSGSYTLTCGMGMMYGQINVGATATASNGMSPAVLLLGGIGVVGAGTYVVLRKQRRVAEEPRASKSPGHSDPAPKGLFGLSPVETIVAAGAIGISVLIGLTAGGMFS